MSSLGEPRNWKRTSLALHVLPEDVPTTSHLHSSLVPFILREPSHGFREWRYQPGRNDVLIYLSLVKAEDMTREYCHRLSLLRITCCGEVLIVRARYLLPWSSRRWRTWLLHSMETCHFISSVVVLFLPLLVFAISLKLYVPFIMRQPMKCFPMPSNASLQSIFSRVFGFIRDTNKSIQRSPTADP